jgi:outer membrane immunogenic protein
MRRVVGIALAAVFAVGLSSEVRADRPFSWSGLYVGVHAGLGTGQSDNDFHVGGTYTYGVSLSGAVGGGQIGYNWQTGSTVYGVEASYSASTLEGNTVCVAGFNCLHQVKTIGTATGRLGLAMDRSLVYVLGGVAWGDVDTNASSTGFVINSQSNTHVGWVGGLGLEHALSKNLTARVEYRHIDLGGETNANTTFIGLPSKVDATVDTLTVGVNYKF